MQIDKIKYSEVTGNVIFIDVRSPKEFYEDFIPGSINIPIFSNEEREIIGTKYVKQSRQEAKILASEFVAPKLPLMLKQIMDFKSEYDNIVIYCARGGYRSRFLTAICNSIDVFCYQLEGGYKAYREEIRLGLPKENERIDYIVLHGNTGTGKTELLKALNELGYDVLDIEAAANHRGSMLGSIGLPPQYSQKKLETNLYKQIKSRKNNIMFVEAESKKIGKVTFPSYIYDKMQMGIHIKITADLDIRANILKQDYGNIEDWHIKSKDALVGIEKYIGKIKTQKIMEMLDQKNFNYVAKELMLSYYDPMYEHTQKKHVFLAEVENTGNHLQTAKVIGGICHEKIKKY